MPWKNISAAAAAISVLVFVLMMGVFIGGLVGAFASRPDPNFNGHAAPGDGFLVMGCLRRLFGFAPNLVYSCGRNVSARKREPGPKRRANKKQPIN
jgi:hypothetical protein